MQQYHLIGDDGRWACRYRGGPWDCAPCYSGGEVVDVVIGTHPVGILDAAGEIVVGECSGRPCIGGGASGATGRSRPCLEADIIRVGSA